MSKSLLTESPSSISSVRNIQDERIDLARSYHIFIEVLFLKLKECFDGTLERFPNAKTLMYSEENAVSSTFRCWAYLKIDIPKSFLGEDFSPNKIDTLIWDMEVKLDDTEVTPEVWQYYPLYKVQAVKSKAQRRTANTIQNEGTKDASLNWKWNRLSSKLLPPQIPESHGRDEKTIKGSLITKIHLTRWKKSLKITLKKRV